MVARIVLFVAVVLVAVCYALFGADTPAPEYRAYIMVNVSLIVPEKDEPALRKTWDAAMKQIEEDGFILKWSKLMTATDIHNAPCGSTQERKALMKRVYSYGWFSPDKTVTFSELNRILSSINAPLLIPTAKKATISVSFSETPPDPPRSN